MKKLFHIIILFISITFASCNAFYVPTLVNTPMFKEKNETSINASVGLNGYNFQGAHSFGPNMAIIANSKYKNSFSEGYHGKCWNKSYGLELGLGYFKNNDNITYELFSGLGGEYNSIYKEIYNWKNNELFTKWNYFIQPSIGYIQKKFELAFSTKLNSLLYNEKSPYNKPNFLSAIEPALTLRIGGKKVKFFVQSGLSIPFIGHNKLPEDFTYFQFNSMQYLNLALGLNIKLGN